MRDEKKDELAVRNKNHEQPETGQLEMLVSLVNVGVPIFQEDYGDLCKSIFCSMYYAAKANITNPKIIFPLEISPVGITWLVDADSYGLGEPDSLIVTTHYERMNANNEFTSRITVKNETLILTIEPMTRDDIIRRWGFMKKLLPEGEIRIGNPAFDIVRWYNIKTKIYGSEGQ